MVGRVRGKCGEIDEIVLNISRINTLSFIIGFYSNNIDLGVVIDSVKTFN